jgi:hypothetical protein
MVRHLRKQTNPFVFIEERSRGERSRSLIMERRTQAGTWLHPPFALSACLNIYNFRRTSSVEMKYLQLTKIISFIIYTIERACHTSLSFQDSTRSVSLYFILRRVHTIRSYGSSIWHEMFQLGDSLHLVAAKFPKFKSITSRKTTCTCHWLEVLNEVATS